MWSTKIKLVECECIGKFSFKCNSDYCGLDKQACDGLNKRKIAGIKKCVTNEIKFSKRLTSKYFKYFLNFYIF